MPAVNVSWYRFGESTIPRCTCDERAVAELAAKYFIELGFRQFAYCGSSIRPDYIDRFGEAFVEILQRHTYRCHCHSSNWHPDSIMPPASEFERLMDWLRGLPKPIALLAFDSLQARQVTEACEAAGVHVPHEVAVLGGEYDFLSCTISKPQLSSIDHAPRRVGYKAAELLSRIMAGAGSPREPVLIPPNRIITCQSTDTVAVDDDLLAAAVQFIKRHSDQRIQVSDILHEVPISRRALEKGFRKWLGRSPAEEIRRIRVDRAVQLLCDTSWSMPRIATAGGLHSPGTADAGVSPRIRHDALRVSQTSPIRPARRPAQLHSPQLNGTMRAGRRLPLSLAQTAAALQTCLESAWRPVSSIRHPAI